MRKKRFLWNTISSLISKLVAIICAFILPRFILQAYGTEINGLVSSISQFLMVIALTEFGITAVVQSALYKPLAEKDFDSISKIMVSSTKFFRKIAYILIIYVAILCIVFPLLVNDGFEFWYTVGIILAMSINSLSQYLFGIANSQLIAADQRSYIISNIGTIVNVLNTLVCCVLIYIGASIQVVKLASALIYVTQPIAYAIYVKKHYNLDYTIKYDTEPIKQKWNGVAQHIAYYVLNATDVIVLTLLSTLENVSIYCVYKLVLSGIHQLFSIFETSVKPLFGEIWALKEKIQFKKYFYIYEWSINTIVCFVFGCTLTLIVPFVKVYTNGINDANYIVPFFAVIITLGYAIQNIRNPYNILIMSVGHYKQTQKNYIITAIINIIISVISVYKFGLIGVAIGTLIALFYQTCWQAWYVHTQILQSKIIIFFKILSIDTLILIIGYILTSNTVLNEVTYIGWLIMAIKVSLIWFLVVLTINIIFYKDKILFILQLASNKKIHKQNIII